MIRSFLALAAFAVAAWVLQGLLPHWLPDWAVPDFVLIVTLAAAVVCNPASGLLLAAGAGYGADLLSGALLGQHALLRVGQFVATRFLSAQFHLARSFPLAVFTFVWVWIDALAFALQVRLFRGAWIVDLGALPVVLGKAVTGAILAPLVTSWMRGAVEWLSEGEARREVRLETRRPVL